MAKAREKKFCVLELDRMTTAEKIRTMETLWDDLCRRSDEISSPLWHNDVLMKREQSVLTDEALFVDWELAKAKIRESISENSYP